MMRPFFLFSLAACSLAPDDLDTGYTEDVVCSHPSSQFEAQVEVNYRDDGFDSVEFVLEQNEEFWFVELQPPSEEVADWHTKMQIIEFDCYSDFTYDFIISEGEK